LAERPADECPFPKPFPSDFDDCPAYQPSEFIGLDLQYHPLPPVWTCSNLEIKAFTSGSHGFYGRCRLGDAAARMRWVHELHSTRLDKIRHLQREFGEVLSPGLSELWALKGRQLRAMRSPTEDTNVATVELEAFVRRMLTDIETFLEERMDILREANLPLNALMEIMEDALTELVQQPTSAATWRIPDHILERFPEDVRILFRPEQLAS
jgi:hypothetical protein